MNWTTKFGLGDKVYVADVDWTEKWVECPDCKGRKMWITTTPAKEIIETPCPTCSYGFEGPHGKIKMSGYIARASSRTVGQVRFEIDTEKEEIVYMMKETGVGSGRLINEEVVFAKREDAFKKAKELTLERKIDERKRLEENQKRNKRNIKFYGRR